MHAMIVHTHILLEWVMTIRFSDSKFYWME